ncbi:MAG TPA: DUF4388 domain-containing protein [Firmicutes bacterium]|nr:DUF4388 domain-containing protein [Bacillota bacterium]
MEINGSLIDINLSNILILLNLTRETGFLVIERKDETGTIYIEDGQIVDARLGNKIGLPALKTIIHWQYEHFEFHSRLIVPEKSINRKLINLINESLRRVDVYFRLKDLGISKWLKDNKEEI